ncbi:unnamed protein product [Lymnaea stagnalis]|uniref:Immunoglobulin domain-containing protein n=1 Tax=Lymnaea stagnalis TaxID=6523 RepID=A0AAV2HHM3_LYMST
MPHVTQWLPLCALLCLLPVSAVDIGFDEPETKYVQLGSTSDILCLVFSNLTYLNEIKNWIQIVRSNSTRQTILSQGSNVITETDFYDVTKLRINKAPPVKLELLFKLSPVRIVDGAEFKCRIVNIWGDIQEEGRVKLQVVKTPSKPSCFSSIIDTYSQNIKVTCLTKSYPKALCSVRTQNSQDSLGFQVEYNRLPPDQTGVITTTCSIDVPSSYRFQVLVAPDVLNSKNFTVASDWISGITAGSATISSFTANKQTDYALVAFDGDLKFSCLVSGSPAVYLSLSKSTLGGADQFLFSSKYQNRLDYEIEDVDCQDGGVYICQADIDPRSAKRITVDIKTCSSGSYESDATPTSIFITVCVVVPILGIALIALIIFGIVCCIRRSKRSRNPRCPGTVLSIATNLDGDSRGREHAYDNFDGIHTFNPPPYSSVCYSVGKDILPPPYATLTGADIIPNTMVPTAPVYVSNRDLSQPDQLVSVALNQDPPPPYSHS